nr:uncharacterized protein LOC108128942 [Drosophila bipectinata]
MIGQNRQNLDNTSFNADAARISSLEIQRRWPDSKAKISFRNYPVQYVLLPSARGGYTRRYVHNLGKAAAAPTTERPLVRVWNSFVRSVTPSISFRNLTNPLANFFNDGTANIIETSPVVLQAYDDEQNSHQEEPYPVVQESSNKRRRKRRKQQKRRPTFGSEEYGDPYNPYDPYFTQSPPLSPEQPMFFYDTNSGNYYGVQRYSPQDFQANFFNSFHAQDEAEPEVESPAEQIPVLRKLSTRKVTLLRPLPLSSAKVQSQSHLAETVQPEPTNSNEEVAEESDLNDSTATSDAPTSEDDGEIDSQSPLSESMRNSLGAYMRDDHHTRQRQRQSGIEGRVFDSSAKVSPRNQQRRYFRLGAW